MSRAELIDAIVEASGLSEVAASTKTAFLAEAKESAKMGRAEMKNLSPETLVKLEAASDKYSESIAGAWSVEESMAVWKNAYGADFTDAELRQILAHIKSPTGQKELAASKRAVKAWRAFIAERSRMAAEAATKEQSEAIARIFAEEYRTN